MTGLLERLGARATGTGWAVRSDARLPFGADRLGDGDPPVAEPATPAPLQAPAPALRASAPAAHPQATPPLDATSHAVPHAPAPLRPVGTRATIQSASHASTGSAEPTASAAPASPQPGHPTPRATTFQAPHARHTPQAPQHPAAPSTPHDGPLPSHRQDPPPLRPPRADVAPTPLLPASQPDHGHRAATGPAPQARPQRATLTANAWPAATPAPAEAPTEVHIHIGRIDVTALPATPAPRTARPARTEPMSLDSYLKQRNGA